MVGKINRREAAFKGDDMFGGNVVKVSWERNDRMTQRKASQSSAVGRVGGGSRQGRPGAVGA